MSSPRQVITGGKSPVFVDWLRFAIPAHRVEGGAAVAAVLAAWAGVPVRTVARLNAKGEAAGWQGYESSASVMVGDAVLGLVAWGGAKQNGWLTVDLPGAFCRLIQDWRAVRDFVAANGGRLSRVDLAADFLHGERTVDECIALYLAGEFAGNGRPPSAQHVDDLGSGRGRTLYVGARAGGKYLRVYEKGKQMRDPTRPEWVRVEIEFKAREAVLPLSMLVECGRFMAGAYPAFAGWFSEEPAQLVHVDRPASVTLQRAVAIARQQVGGLLNVLAYRAGWSASKVVRVLLRGEPARRVVGVIPRMPDDWRPVDVCDFGALDALLWEADECAA